MIQRDILDQQVDDLRDRMRLLQQDRRANVDLLEANKSSNSQEIRSLRDENKKLRLKLTQLQKRLSTDRGEQHELVTFQREALHLRTDYDSLKVVSNKNLDEMNKLKDEARICELEATKPYQDKGPLAKQIRMLENKLDKAIMKYNEAQSIRGTYAHIVKRLKDERLSFNNQLTALERTLKAKKRDLDELLILSGDASHAREIAQHELQQSRSAYEERKARRAGEMRERQQVVKIRRQMIEKQERRDTKKREVLDQQMEKLRRDAAKEAGHLPYSMMQNKELEEEQERKLKIYEEVFEKIKDATGVSAVDDVIDKIVSQRVSRESLVSLTKQNDLRINELKEEIKMLNKTVEEHKFSGHIVDVSRKTVDEKKEILTACKCKYDRAKNQFDRTSSVLMSAKAGVKHLQQKVEAIGKELKIGTETEINLSNDSDIDKALWSAGNVLIELMARIREEEMNNLHDIESGNDKSLDASDMNASIEYEYALQEKRPYNQRITLPSAKDDLYENDSSSEVFTEADEEELSRDRVKQASTRIIRAQNRNKATDLVYKQ